MTATQGLIRVRRDEQTLTILVEGRATMVHGLPLRRFAEECLAGGVTALRVDLRRCTYMDSTFLGTLLFLKRTLDRRRGEFTFVSPSAECVRLLREMGVDTVCPVVTGAEPEADSWPELPTGPQDVGACKGNVVQAHQELAGLAGPAGEAFRKVMRCLESDPGAKR